MPKRSIRAALLAKRKQCSAETCLARSRQIQARFIQSEPFREAGCLALYSAIHNEVHTDEIARAALDQNKQLLYPRVTQSRLEFAAAGPDNLRRGAFGVLEPCGENCRDVGDIDLLVVPGIAFDLQGHRLGYGKGFYDRALSCSLDKTVRIGLAYDFQLVDVLPVDEHDRPLSAVMTETRTLWFDADQAATIGERLSPSKGGELL